jgi:hypothetical protein
VMEAEADMTTAEAEAKAEVTGGCDGPAGVAEAESEVGAWPAMPLLERG